MDYASFSGLVGHAADDAHVVALSEDKLTLAQPLKPPGKWVRFKAALAHLPLLGQMASVRRARLECESYPLRLERHRVANRQVLVGFMASLRQEFGDGIAEATQGQVGLHDDVPLTARRVRLAIESATGARDHFRSRNNITVTQLLDGSLPSEVEVGSEAAVFIRQQAMGRCADLPEHSRGLLTNEQLVKAMDDSLKAYEELRDMPGLAPDQRTASFAAANRLKNGPFKVRANAARKHAVLSRVESFLDRRDPRSLLNQRANEVAREGGLAQPWPAGVLKSIGSGLNDWVATKYSSLRQALQPGDDLHSLVNALEVQLTAHIDRALGEHLEAVKLIDSSTRFNDAQKALMREFAGSRRLDKVQVARYESMAATMGKAIEACADWQRDPSTAVEHLKACVREFERSHAQMCQHGAQFWEAQSLGGGEFTLELSQQFMRLAAAGTGKSAEQLRQMDPGRMKPLVHQAPVQARFLLAFMVESLGLGSGMPRDQAAELGKVVSLHASDAPVD